MGDALFPGLITDYMVLVRTITYNQAKYIKDNMDGVAMQQTNFPFVHLVMDDASTDGEQDVIMEWLNEHCDMDNAEFVDMPLAKVILVNHKTNVNCSYAIYLLKQNLYKQNDEKIKMYQPWREHSRYEALCEGDDFWIDPYKLKKQVDFLDSNPDYSMCFHGANLLVETDVKHLRARCCCVEDRDYSATELIGDWIVPTASMVFRIHCLKFPIIDEDRILNGDIILVQKCAHCGKVKGLPDHMSVYRIQHNGVTYDTDIMKRRMELYPSHLECIKDSFPKVDSSVINVLISESYFQLITSSNRLSIRSKYFSKSFHADKITSLKLSARFVVRGLFKHIL